MIKIDYQDLGFINYKDAWDYQIALFEQLLQNKNSEQANTTLYLLFCQHQHVYTIGKHGNKSNLLISENQLFEKGIAYYHIDRGGDITYHGPGQQVVYPVFDLDEFRINTKEYVFRLEQAIIDALEKFSISGTRLDGAAGIWLDAQTRSKARKICAIGIKSSRRITMHGIALNVNTDLSYFSYMNPCGFIDKGVTSMQTELGHQLDQELVKRELYKSILKQFET
jgi:lipoyl(octanoyl) transferase